MGMITPPQLGTSKICYGWNSRIEKNLSENPAVFIMSSNSKWFQNVIVFQNVIFLGVQK